MRDRGRDLSIILLLIMSPYLPLAVPIYYSLELTSQCSGKCSPCSNVFTRLRPALPIESWQYIIKYISTYAETIKITGGEPTIHPQFFEIVQLVASFGIPFAVFTNARWADSQSLIRFFSSLPSVFKGLLISLHGPDAASHAAFTGDIAAFDETCANIRCAADAGVRIYTSTVITTDNFDRLSEIARLSQSLGAKRAVFNRYLGLADPGLEPADAQLRHAIGDIEVLHRSLESSRSIFSVKYGNCIPQCFTSSASTGCWAGVAYCTIDPWGNLRPCNHSVTIAGNILEEPLDAIWRNEKMEGWRRLSLEQCETCSEVDTCNGGCRALIEIRNNDPLIRQSVESVEPILSIELELYENSHPILACRVQSEPFGYALIRGATMLQVTHQAKAVLDRLNGQYTLQQLNATIGREAVDFIGSLYCYQMVEFL